MLIKDKNKSLLIRWGESCRPLSISPSSSFVEGFQNVRLLEEQAKNCGSIRPPVHTAEDSQELGAGGREGGGEPVTYISQDSNGIRQVPNAPLFPHAAETQTKKIKVTSKNNHWAKSCLPTGRYISLTYKIPVCDG